MPLVFLLALAAAPSPKSDLETAKHQHGELEFEACLRTLDRAARHQSSTNELAEISLWQGLCAAGVDDAAAALKHFTLARQLAPQIALPGLSAPKVVELFEAAKPALVPAVTPVAPTLVDTPPAPPPEVRRPWWLVGTLAGVGAVAGGVSLGFGLQARALASEANAATFGDDSERLGLRAKNGALVSNVLLGVAVTAAVAAVLVAVLSGGPSS